MKTKETDHEKCTNPRHNLLKAIAQMYMRTRSPSSRCPGFDFSLTKPLKPQLQQVLSHFNTGNMPRAIEKLMLHPAQCIENAECDITRFIMASPTLGGLEEMLTERKPKGDYSTVSVFPIVSHTAGKTTMHTTSLMNGVSSCLVCEYALSVSLQPK